MLGASVNTSGGMPNLRAINYGGMGGERPRPVRPIGPAYPRIPSYKKGGKVRKTGLAILHKGETVIPKKRSSISRTMGGSKKKSKAILQRVGKELKNNPPRILKKTARKKGAAQAAKQKVAILLSKSRRAGANV